MDAQILAGRQNTSSQNMASGKGLVNGIVALVFVIAATSLFVFVRTDQVGHKLQAINRLYIPGLKHLNLLYGKWSGYRRTTEQYIQFARWGEKNLELGGHRMHLKRVFEQDLAELTTLSFYQTGFMNSAADHHALGALVERARAVTDKENERLAEIAVYVKSRRLEDAARVYMELKSDHVALSHAISSTIRDFETSAAALQLSAEQDAQQTNVIMFTLVGLSLLAVLVLTFRMRRWILPLIEWRQATAQMAAHIAKSGFSGLREGVQLPKVDRHTPAEFVLLTREMKNMSMTLVEHEKTIQGQKAKLEGLNQHLKGQNEVLRKLGSLNERILNAISNGIVVLDAHQRAEQFNDEFVRMFSVARHSIIGAQANALLTDVGGFAEDEVAAWLSHSDPQSLRHLRNRDGRIFNVSVQLLPTQGRVISFEDATALVRSEERLAHAQRLALAGHMSAQVAHEIRNPLNSMMLQLEMLGEDIDALPANESESAHGRLTKITEQVERLERITQRYLMTEVQGAIQADNTGTSQTVDIHELIESILEFCSAEVQARGICVSLDLSATQPLVHADRDRLAEVIMNLVKNAIEALGGDGLLDGQKSSGDKRIQISTRVSDGKLAIEVRDNGPGLTARVRERLFEPFVTSKPSGHGLGLSLSRQICLDHGGDLSYREPVSAGACFEVTLPC